MRQAVRLIGAAALLYASAVGAQIHGDAAALDVQTVSGVWGHVYAVQLHADDRGGTIVTGKVRKSPAGGSRLLLGRVWVDVVDSDGAVLASYDGRPRRSSPARHTNRAEFAVAIDTLPAGADGVRIGYR